MFAYWDTLWNRYDKWMRPAAERHAAVSGIEYYCPMHPQVVQDEPGSCPICGMPLAKRKKGEKATLPEGVTARVELAPFRVEQAGIKTAEVAYAPLTETLTTVGYVAFDERRMANIVSKVPGKSRVEKLYVNFTGQDVEAGQPLAELYSPELSQAIQELLNAARRAGAGRSSRRPTWPARSWPTGARWSALSAEKLKRWGITQAQIDEILKKGKTDFTIPILSPIGGHVFKKNVVEGQEVRRATRCSRSPTCTPSGSRPRSTSTNWAWSTRGRRSRRPSRRSRARPSRARSSSSSRTSTRRPGPSRSGTPWTTPAIGSGPACSPR